MNLVKYILVSLIFITAHGQAASSKPQGSSNAQNLNQAAYDGKLDLLKKEVTSKNINQANDKGQTLLMSAVSNGQIEVVQFLLSKKADLNIKDKEQNSALFFAITNEQPQSSKLLIEAGAELTSLNELQDSALTLATSLNDQNTMKLILKKNAGLINKGNKEKKTALMEGARHGSTDTVKILLDAGADTKAKDDLGRTALDIAKKAQNHDVAKLIANKK